MRNKLSNFRTTTMLSCSTVYYFIGKSCVWH